MLALCSIWGWTGCLSVSESLRYSEIRTSFWSTVYLDDVRTMCQFQVGASTKHQRPPKTTTTNIVNTRQISARKAPPYIICISIQSNIIALTEQLKMHILYLVVADGLRQMDSFNANSPIDSIVLI